MIRFTPAIAQQICGLLGLNADDTQTLVLSAEGVFVTTLRRNASGRKFVDPVTGEIAKDYAFAPLRSVEEL